MYGKLTLWSLLSFALLGVLPTTGQEIPEVPVTAIAPPDLATARGDATARPQDADALFRFAWATEAVRGPDEADPLWKHFLTVEGQTARAAQVRAGRVPLRTEIAKTPARDSGTFALPVLSPDGRRLFYGWQSVALTGMQADAPIRRKSFPAGWLANASDWSPDGTLLAITLKDPQGPNLALIAQVGAGGELQEVQRVPGMLARFSPDGGRVLISSVPGTEIAILDLKTGEQQAVPRVTNANRNHAAWCLDGKHILYHTYPQANTPSRPLSLHALPEAGAKPDETLRPLVENGARNELPRVAPDDGAIAYIAAAGLRKSACLADAQGRYCVALLDAQAAVWAPDGRSLYLNDRQGRLVVLRFGGLPQPVRLTPAYAAGQGPLTSIRVETRAQAETKLHLALLAYDADSRLIRVTRDAGGTPTLAPGGKVDIPVELGEAAPNAVTLKAMAYGEGVPMVIRLFPVRQP